MFQTNEVGSVTTPQLNSTQQAVFLLTRGWQHERSKNKKPYIVK